MISSAPFRPVNVLGREATFDHRADGTIYVRSPRRPGNYPEKLTQKLEHWAAAAPDRTFLAQRSADDGWRRITYGETLQLVQSTAQALINRSLSASTPVAILSGNSIEHGVLALACMYAGVPYAPISPSYSLASKDLTTLRSLWESLDPALVFAAEGVVFERPLSCILNSGTEFVTVSPPESLSATPFAELTSVPIGRSLDEAYKKVTADTVAKILFTSGSTGAPKGVITTNRMLCSNQQMLREVMGCLAEEPPVLCDWLPWNHTFGGSHNFGIVLYNGGTLYIDEGSPTHSDFATTLRNLRDVATTAYFNVPRGYEMLAQALRGDAEFSRHFFSRVKILFYAAAGLHQSVLDELQELAVDACGERILMIAGLGATESSPLALATGIEGAFAGDVGLPVPGVEMKLVPAGDKLEMRLRGPNISPGFWRSPELTAAAFDEEHFYKLGDSLAFCDPQDPLKGFSFDGRIDDDFKLSTGTWVSVGPLRARFLSAFAGLAQDVVFAAPNRAYLAALIFPLPGASTAALQQRLESFAVLSTGNSTRVERALLVDEPARMDAGELTPKGTINQQVVLKNRAGLVEELFVGSPRVFGMVS